MNTLKTWMVAGSVLLVISAASPALGQQHYACSEFEEEKMLLEEHQTLYKYSLVAGVPSKQSDHTCGRMPKKLLLDLSDFNGITQKLVMDLYKDTDFELPLFYEDKDDFPYIACSTDQRPSFWVIFRISWKTFPRNKEEGSLVVVPRVLLGRAAIPNKKIEEEIKFELRSHPSTHNRPKGLMAIRGTDMGVLEQWNASIQDVLSSSCAFGFMVDFVDRLFNHLGGLNKHIKYEELVVVGHSLGGTATQHIAQTANVAKDVSRFRAYAYGALGRSGKKLDRKTVVSYFIDGDPVADFLSSRLSYHQIGSIVEYKPYWWWRFWSGGRHSLESIQDALCECLDRTGSLNIQP